MIKHSKLSSQKIRRILELFLNDFTAMQSAEILGLSHNTLNQYYGIFREEIVELSIQESQESGEFKVDGGYFGAKRVRGKRGRGVAGKSTGLINYTLVWMESRGLSGTGFRNGLILNEYDHYRVFHSHNEFVRGKSHVNGIEAF